MRTINKHGAQRRNKVSEDNLLKSSFRKSSSKTETDPVVIIP